MPLVVNLSNEYMVLVQHDPAVEQPFSAKEVARIGYSIVEVSFNTVLDL